MYGRARYSGQDSPGQQRGSGRVAIPISGEIKETAKRLSVYLKTAPNQRAYVNWMREIILEHTAPGERVLVVCTKRLFEAERIPDWPAGDPRFNGPESYTNRYEWDVDTNFAAASASMAKSGVPAPALVATIGLQLVSGIAIAVGWHARLGAAALGLFCLATAILFHANFVYIDVARRRRIFRSGIRQTKRGA
jgi:hypothetical protein